MVEWETGEITDEPLSLIAADDPVTCAEYAKKHDLLHLDGWKRFKHIAKNQKQLTRAINQSKIRQVRRSAVYQFGFLIPKDYKQALQLDEQNGDSKWYDATKLEMDQINEYKVFQDHVKAQYETYRSGVGTLLYLTKHSRPDISNPVRELSKNMDAPAPVHLKEMYKLIRFVLSTKDYGLKFKLIKSIRNGY